MKHKVSACSHGSTVMHKPP